DRHIVGMVNPNLKGSAPVKFASLNDDVLISVSLRSSVKIDRPLRHSIDEIRCFRPGGGPVLASPMTLDPYPQPLQPYSSNCVKCDVVVPQGEEAHSVLRRSGNHVHAASASPQLVVLQGDPGAGAGIWVLSFPAHRPHDLNRIPSQPFNGAV